MNSLLGSASGTMGSFRPTGSLSPYPNPEPTGLMAILKAYFDDSGNASAPSEKVLTIAGYMSDLDSWSKFDVDWKDVLDRFQVPYLHMKEFWQKDGIYKEIKNDSIKEMDFFQSLIKVIGNHTKMRVQCSVMLDDLRKFNRDYGLQLDPYGLAIYGCMMGLENHFKTQQIDLVFDKFPKSMAKTHKALEYAGSDIVQPVNPDRFNINHLGKNQSMRTILPLQAADFFAWESRKAAKEHVLYIGAINPHTTKQEAIKIYNKCAQECVRENGHAPRDRQSFKALRDATPERGFILNYEVLKLIRSMHPYGWTIRKYRKGSRIRGFERSQN